MDFRADSVATRVAQAGFVRLIKSRANAGGAGIMNSRRNLMTTLITVAAATMIAAWALAGGGALARGTGNARQSSPKSTEASPAQAAPAIPSSDQILDRCIEASGGRVAWQKLNTRVSKGTVDVPAMNLAGTVEMWQKAPNRILVTVAVAGAVFTQGFDGSVGWSNDPQNGLREQTDGELVETKRDADFYHILDFRKLYSTISAAGAEKVGERSAYVVEATPPEGGDPNKAYFDTQTGLLLREVTQHHDAEGNVEPFTEEFEDYRTVDGVKVPFTIHQSTPQTAFTIRLDEVHHNVAVDNALFAKPSAQTPPSAQPQ